MRYVVETEVGNDWKQLALDDFMRDDTFKPSDFESFYGRAYKTYCDERGIEP